MMVGKLTLTWKGKEQSIEDCENYSFNGYGFKENIERSINFDTTENIIIEGDNLDVLKLLQSEYQSKVKMIYIDPPYNTGNKGVYKDKYWKARECKHSNWLSMMYPRLKLARELLRDDGVIFVSIDDKEQANLKLLMDEVFGEENFVCNMPRKTKPSVTTKSKAELQTLHDYVLAYLKQKPSPSFNLKKIGIKEYPLEDGRGRFYIVPLQDNGPHGTKTARPNLHYPIYYKPNGELSLDKKDGSIELLPKKHKSDDGTWMWSKKKFQKDVNDLYVKDIYHKPNGELSLEKKDGSIELLPKKHQNDDGRWMWSKKKFQKDVNDLYVKDRQVFIKHYYDASEDQNKYQTEKTWLDQFPNRLGSTTLSDLDLKNIMSYPKPMEMIKFLITISTQANDIILDFFAGSGTTGHAVMQLNLEEKKQAIENGEDPTLVGNRKYIMVQLPELIDGKTDAYKEGYKKISDITIERVKRAGNKISEENPDVNLDVGFKVCELIS